MAKRFLSSDEQALITRLALALEENPGYVSVKDAASVLRISTQAFQRYHENRVECVISHGVKLYELASVKAYAQSRKPAPGSRMTFTGVSCERIQRICETYYRTQFDAAPSHLLALAKKVARL